MPFRSNAIAAIGSVLALLLGLLAMSTQVAAAPSERATASVEHGAAQEALAAARALFDGDDSARRSATAGRDATLVLRELMSRRGELTGADRQEAEALLSRPGASRRKCTPRVCVHWKPSQVNPGYIDTVLSAVNRVHKDYVAAGYRAPKPDGSRGGDKRTDIYIRDVGAQGGLYGYCTSDQVLEQGRYDVWAYCVLDNDYRKGQFPTNTPIQNMRVTAAHEYFHAVQFAYDAFEDGWFMEATATWAEDEEYDGINDNVSYLPYGPLARPRLSLDKFVDLHHYGDWIYFRHLTERYPADRGGLPRIILAMWKLLDGAPGGPDLYSVQAITRVLKDRGSSFKAHFADFNDANLRPDETYEESVENNYPRAPDWRTFVLSPGAPSTTMRSVDLNHLSSATARFVASPTPGDWDLRVRLNMANKTRGSVARVTTNYSDDTHHTVPVALDADGNGVLTVPFSSDSNPIDSVDVTMVNASTRMRNCWRGSPFSCQGESRDDDLTQKIRGTAMPG